MVIVVVVVHYRIRLVNQLDSIAVVVHVDILVDELHGSVAIDKGAFGTVRTSSVNRRRSSVGIDVLGWRYLPTHRSSAWHRIVDKMVRLRFVHVVGVTVASIRPVAYRPCNGLPFDWSFLET